MCDLCNIHPIYVNNRFVRNTKKIETGFNVSYVSLNFGVDKNGNYVIYASGEDYTDDFIIQYCPKCGRKLI